MTSLYTKLGRWSSNLSRKDSLLNYETYKWDSMRTFVYLSYAMSGSNETFDMFSKIGHKKNAVSIFDFLIYQFTLGMSYLYMDVFIKQYTRKLDFNQNLNPLLRGVHYGMLMQTMIWLTLVNGAADASRYFLRSLSNLPLWSVCPRKLASTCLTNGEIAMRCRNNEITTLNITAVHLNYMREFVQGEGGTYTTRIFVSGLVWITAFFISTLTPITLVKLLKVLMMLSAMFTLVAGVAVIFTVTESVAEVFTDLLRVNVHYFNTQVIIEIMSVYQIGGIGLHDMGTSSAFMTVDNAILISGAIITILALFRSVIVKLIFLSLQKCIHLVGHRPSTHYLLFVILPLGTQFIHAQKFIMLYIFLYMILSQGSYTSLTIAVMSRLINSEHKKIKVVYVSGILCYIGFLLSLVLILFYDYWAGIKSGMLSLMLLLGALKVMLVMWLYGLTKFSRDIEFWLQYKPTKYWKICWTFLPIFLSAFAVHRMMDNYKMPRSITTLSTAGWIGFTMFIVLFFHIKIIITYIMHSNLVGAFRSSPRYGPPDPEARRQRRNFDGYVQPHNCEHVCLILDTKLDCMHDNPSYRKRTPRVAELEPGGSTTEIYMASRDPKAANVIDADDDEDQPVLDEIIP